jgi:hypothetical protein
MRKTAIGWVVHVLQLFMFLSSISIDNSVCTVYEYHIFCVIVTNTLSLVIQNVC